MKQDITIITLRQTALNDRKVNFKKINFLLAVSFCLVILPWSKPLFAQGVAAGTDISNTVIVNYKMAGEAQTPIESSPSGNSSPGLGSGQATVFKVDRKVDLLVTSNGNSDVTPGDLQAELSFSLLNEGNDSQEFMLIPDSSLASDIFDTSNCATLVTSVSGTPLAGVVVPTSGNITLKADQEATISVTCDIPALNGGQPILVGQDSLLSLIAVAEKNIDGSNTTETSTADSDNSVDTVFADNSGTDDAVHDASHSSRGSYIALDSINPTPPTLSINKTIVSVTDQQGGTTAVTGSEVVYKIAITSNGTGVINNIVITDITPAEMIYKTGSITLDNTSLTDGSDSDEADFGLTSLNTATVNLGNITAGSQHEIQLTYTIN